MIKTEAGNTYIFCDCCGREKLGEIRDDKLILMDRRHGRRHMTVISITELAKAAGLTSPTGKV